VNDGGDGGCLATSDAGLTSIEQLIMPMTSNGAQETTKRFSFRRFIVVKVPCDSRECELYFALQS
jgi:hypothetical protein